MSTLIQYFKCILLRIVHIVSYLIRFVAALKVDTCWILLTLSKRTDSNPIKSNAFLIILTFQVNTQAETFNWHIFSTMKTFASIQNNPDTVMFPCTFCMKKPMIWNIKVQDMLYLLYLCDAGVELSSQGVLLTSAIGLLNSVGRLSVCLLMLARRCPLWPNDSHDVFTGKEASPRCNERGNLAISYTLSGKHDTTVPLFS